MQTHFLPNGPVCPGRSERTPLGSFHPPLLPNPASGTLSPLDISKGDPRLILHRTKAADVKVTVTKVTALQTQHYISMNTRGLNEHITSCLSRHMMSFTHLRASRTQVQDFAHQFLMLQPVPNGFDSSVDTELSNRGDSFEICVQSSRLKKKTNKNSWQVSPRMSIYPWAFGAIFFFFFCINGTNSTWCKLLVL